MNTQHTPLPWKVYYAKNNGQVVLGTGEENGCAIQSHSGGFYRDDDEAKANAEFVVRACNSHYELLEALEARKQYHEQFGYRSPKEEELHKMELSAIAKARGQ